MNYSPPAITLCDREPIQTPGSIQPHGMMLVLDPASHTILYVAGAVEKRLGLTEWAGQPLASVIGSALSEEAARLLTSNGLGGYLGRLAARSGETLDVSVHLSELYLIVELEPSSREGSSAAGAIDALAMASARLERALTLEFVCDQAAIEFRRLTGFDRVMIYRFLDDAAGKVVAEARSPNLATFLNHHFPASDIPRQARALYLRNLVRVIPDSCYKPVPLRPEWMSPAPLDMSDSSLRSVSPVHLQYLANMGVKASTSFSIVKDGALWGLVACHHNSPRLLGYDSRAAGRALAGSLAREIKVKEEAEGLRQRLRLRAFDDDFLALLSCDESTAQTLPKHAKELRQIMDGDGIAILLGSEVIRSGICPEANEIQDLAAWLLRGGANATFSTNCLGEVYAPALEFTQSGSGVLAMVLSPDDPWVVFWFRAEQVKVIEWAGAPHKDGFSDPAGALTPRASFAAWTETVRGSARAWSASETDAATHLRSGLLALRQNQRVLALNRQLTLIVRDKDILLQQKEFLIGEVNHRVQNSLTLVASFLGLQSRASKSPDLHAAFEEARRRITAIALVHRRLYRGDKIEVVDAARYIEELCADTFSFMGREWAEHLTLSLSPLQISTDRAVTLGLVITELLINSNKHAYGGAAGPIAIELIEGRSNFCLIVSDKGSGNAPAPDGFGSRIMAGMLQQLAGELTYDDNHPGLRVTLTVPMQLPKPPPN